MRTRQMLRANERQSEGDESLLSFGLLSLCQLKANLILQLHRIILFEDLHLFESNCQVNFRNFSPELIESDKCS